MITRARARRAALWCGLGGGAAAALLYLLSLAVTIQRVAGGERVQIGSGALVGSHASQGIPLGWSVSSVSSGWYFLPRWRDQPGSVDWIVLPLWVPLALGLLCGYFLLPKDPAPGHCPACGFDLRALLPDPATP